MMNDEKPTISRRIFLGGLLAAPAIVRASSLMPIWTPKPFILWADGVHDDHPGLQAWFNGLPVIRADGRPLGNRLYGGNFLLRSTVIVGSMAYGKVIENCAFRRVGGGA